MRALAEHGVAVVSVFADGTRLLAVVSEETFGAVLVTPRPVPASLAGDATALRHLARLLALAVAAPWIVQSKTRPTEREKKNKWAKIPSSKQTEHFHVNGVKWILNCCGTLQMSHTHFEEESSSCFLLLLTTQFTEGGTLNLNCFFYAEADDSEVI